MCVRGKSLSLAPISLGATLSSGDTFPATPFFMRIREKIFKILFLLCAAFSIIASFIICLFLFMNGIPAIQKIGFIDFIFGLKWKPGNDLYGIFPMIAGSLYVTAGAIIFGVPVGLMTAIFLSKFCPKKLHELLKPAIDLLAGIPSVVYGFFGLMVIVPFVRNVFGGNGSSILTASLLLGMMILPTIICVSETSLNSVPQNYYEGARALGASHERSVFLVVLPAAKYGWSYSGNWPCNWRNNGCNYGCRKSGKASEFNFKRSQNSYGKYRNRNGVCSRFASRSVDSNRGCFVCIYPSDKFLL